jgi:2-dehydro-3-deoxyglucarate aldolase/4-hydroxy-2-oxoheptanedioate aldolase
MVTHNRFKTLHSQHKTPIGHMLFEFSTRGVAQILRAAGVDFAVIDMEHGSFTIAQTADMIAWLRGAKVTPFVRVPAIRYEHIARALDAGALGVVAPNVRTAAEAAALVDAARYPPMGHRGFFHGGANSSFHSAPPETFGQYTNEMNENITVVCLIESTEAVANLDEICSTPGIDALWAGYADLAQSQGIAGMFADNRLTEALRRIADAAAQHGLASIIQPNDLTQLERWLDLGFNCISFSADIFVYRDALTTAVAAASKSATARSCSSRKPLV